MYHALCVCVCVYIYIYIYIYIYTHTHNSQIGDAGGTKGVKNWTRVNAACHRFVSLALGYDLHKFESIHDGRRPCVLKSFKVSATGCVSVFRDIRRKRYIVTNKALEKHGDGNRADSKLNTITYLYH